MEVLFSTNFLMKIHYKIVVFGNLITIKKKVAE
jgi:hypothetical protein